MPEEELVTKGLVERIGLKDSIFTIEVNGEKLKQYKISRITLRQLISCWNAFKAHNIINDINDIDGTGHRVVHGGEKFPESVAITDEVEKEIEELSELAPLHNPANLMGIRAFRKLLPNIPHVAILIQHSIKQCLKKHIYIACHIIIIKIMAFVSMVSMVQAINLYHKERQKC
ncbi:hypothetical protein UM834_08205 [Staphylococcus aureus]|nr:hypothetical protein UM834_08205 [Staphylococcus aureus]